MVGHLRKLLKGSWRQGVELLGDFIDWCGQCSTADVDQRRPIIEASSVHKLRETTDIVEQHLPVKLPSAIRQVDGQGWSSKVIGNPVARREVCESSTQWDEDDWMREVEDVDRRHQHARSDARMALDGQDVPMAAEVAAQHWELLASTV